MSTIKSSSEHLTLNADGASKDIKFQANGVEKASISSAGAFTSTTIDATKLTGNLPAIDGSSLTNLPGGGKVLQVVNGTGGSELMTSSTFNSTGLFATITPSATTSKIYVVAHSPRSYHNGPEQLNFAIYRGTSGEGSGTAIQRGATTDSGATGTAFRQPTTMSVYDSPSSTSALTYTVMHSNNNNSTLVGWYEGIGSGVGTLTLIEIGA